MSAGSDGKPRRVTLGRVGQITLQKARQDAQQLIGEMVGGTDPVARKRDQTAGGMTLREGWELTKEAMKKKGRSQATFDDYQSKIDCHLSDWLDLPLVAITREVCRKLHTKIGEEPRHLHGQRHHAGAAPDLAAGTAAASGTARAADLERRFLSRRHGRTAVIKDWPAWWEGIQQIVNPVRRDFYIWLAFSGCRAGETMSMEVEEHRSRKRHRAISDHQDQGVRNAAERLHGRVAAQPHRGERRGIRRELPMGVSRRSRQQSGHLEEEKLTAAEPKLFKQQWSPHTLRHQLDHHRRSEGQDLRQPPARC